jgi:pimeloyl-ACP methyl ester carboxylesterase
VKKLAASGANTVADTTALSQADFDEMKKVVANPKSTPIEKALNQMMIDQPNIAYSELGKIKCPVLIMAGDRDMIKPEHTLKIFQSIPGASLCIFPDSHHGVCQQHPELFNETVLRFFQK